MKKIKFLVFSLIIMLTFNLNVYAETGGKLEVSSTNVYVGDSFTVTVKTFSAAAWNIHVSASGPVNDCSIVEANVTNDALDTDKTFSTTCTTTGEGTVTITLSGDVASSASSRPQSPL